MLCPGCQQCCAQAHRFGLAACPSPAAAYYDVGSETILSCRRICCPKCVKIIHVSHNAKGRSGDMYQRYWHFTLFAIIHRMPAHAHMHPNLLQLLWRHGSHGLDEVLRICGIGEAAGKLCERCQRAGFRATVTTHGLRHERTWPSRWWGSFRLWSTLCLRPAADEPLWRW